MYYVYSWILFHNGKWQLFEGRIGQVSLDFFSPTLQKVMGPSTICPFYVNRVRSPSIKEFVTLPNLLSITST